MYLIVYNPLATIYQSTHRPEASELHEESKGQCQRMQPPQRAAEGTSFHTQDSDTATADPSVGVKPTAIVSSVPNNLWKKITKSNEVYPQELGSKEQRDQFWYLKKR